MSPKAGDDLVSMDDKQLAAALASGRDDALTHLFQRYHHAVFRRARRILGDYGEAEEVTIQVFLEMYQHISEFDREKGAFSSWLLSRAKFRAMNRREELTSERFYEWIELNEEAVKSNTRPNNSAYRLEIDPILEEVLAKLPLRKRRVIELTFLEGLTAGEIAEQTKESVHAVRHLLSRGLKELRATAQKRIWKKQRRD